LLLNEFRVRYVQRGMEHEAAQVEDLLLQQYGVTVEAKSVALEDAAAMVKELIRSGEDAGALEAIDGLVSEYRWQEDLGEVMLGLGRAYMGKGLRLLGSEAGAAEGGEYLWTAIGIWERMIEELPGKAWVTPEAYRMMVVCYVRLGEKSLAKDTCEMLLKEWPDYRYSKHTVWLVEGLGGCDGCSD